MWVLVPLGLFLLLSYVGRQSRLGRLKPGPWIRQFRTVRSLLSLALLVLGVAMLTRGEIWVAIGCFVTALGLSGSVRIQAYFRDQASAPATAASYSQDEIRAYQTLGLSIGASKKAIRDAWKKLMKDAHPDQGGDAKRASALNAARDVLLKRRK